VPRRVLFLAWAPFFSGAERALILTAQHLDPSRFIPHVVAGTDGDMVSALRDAGVACDVIPLANLDRRHPVRWARSIWQLARLARRLKPALIHANDVPSFQPGGYVARLLGLPSVTHVRFPDTAEGFGWFLRPGFSRALFVSEYLRTDALRAAPGIFTGRSDVLYDGVRLPALVDQADVAAVRQSLELPEGNLVIAITGQVSEIKGIWEFVDAARLVTSQGATPTFAVLGDDLRGQGALLRAMKERVEALGMSPHFKFLGFRPDAPRLIPAFDIIAVPSHVEPLGNATLEAMAAARPVVGSDVGGIPEMVVDGETGLLVPPRDATALAGAFLTLLDSDDTRRRFGMAGRRRAESEFSLERHISNLQTIYDSVAGASSNAAR
jgi:glycosyltransferase involved in cell wall biosynthesis